ncbi:MAG: DUF6131 family protein [Acidimicrobiales bacterium]
MPQHNRRKIWQTRQLTTPETPHGPNSPRRQKRDIVIFFGLILLLIGFLTGIAILWTLGVILLIIGLVLWILGSVGHSVGGRRHYF